MAPFPEYHVPASAYLFGRMLQFVDYRVISYHTMEQLHFFPLSPEDAVRQHLIKETGMNIHLAVTDNSSSMLSVRHKGKAVAVRMHRIFLSAGNDVLQEMAGFIRQGKGRTPLIRRFINLNRSRLKKRPSRKISLCPRGKCYDLLDIFASLNKEYFAGRVRCSITWGRSAVRRSARKRTLGSYSHDTGLIRINPLLDTRRVPLYFVEFVVYHEMLHADMGVMTGQGRRYVHSREFRQREKMFSQYEKALTWEKKRWS